MRMARAFIASVPLGIVLVAALVVPLLVIPGTFGFEGWPTSAPSAVTDRAVRPETAAPAAVAVAVDKRPRQVAPVAHRAFASATPAPHKPAAASLSARRTQTPRRAVALVQ